jgi:hypothetical protein
MVGIYDATGSFAAARERIRCVADVTGAMPTNIMPTNIKRREMALSDRERARQAPGIRQGERR